MKTELYADNPTKTFVRQVEDYEAAGLDPQMTLIMPVTIDDDRASIEAKGISWAGLMRQVNQVFRENLGNSFGARVRAAVTKNQPLPTQAELDSLVASYDFSGARTTAETGISEGEKVFRSVLRLRLKDLLRVGVFSEDSETPLVVQSKKESTEKTLPAGKISLEDFEALVDAAAEGADFEFEDRAYAFGGDPEFQYNDDGIVISYENLAAVPAHCMELAEQKLAAERAMKAVKASIPN